MYKATDYPSNTSDHAPIVAVLDNFFVKSTDNHAVIPKIQRYEWGKIDLARYNKYLQLNLDEIQHKKPINGKEIDNLLMHLTNTMKKAADECVPSKHVKQKGHKHRIWSPEIARCVKDNKTAFWEYKQATVDSDKALLKARCKVTKRNLRSAQRKEHAAQRIEEYNNIMRASSEDEILMYNLIRKHKKPPRSLQSELLVNGDLITHPDDVRRTWADHFEMLATPQLDPAFDEKFKAEIDESVSVIQLISKYMAEESIVPFSPDEITTAISRLKRKKAADLENLSAEHIIFGADRLTPVLVLLFNAILKSSHIPKSFKEGMIIPVPKKGKDHRLTDNYRGITITSIVGKVMEHIIQQRLRTQVEHNQSKQQRGFTSGSSSTNAALIMTETIAEAVDDNKELFIASLDAKKAFDVVYQNAMLHKLFYDGLDPCLWNLMFEQYKNASSRVRWNGSFSRTFNLEQGVRQGSVLSTDCYKVFINGLLRTLENSAVGARIGDVYVGSPTCADDVLLAAESMTDLQFMLQVVTKFAAEHRYIIHPSKSTVLIYNSTTPLSVWQESQPFRLGDKPLEISSSCTHLGILRSTEKDQAKLVDERIQLARRTSYALMSVGLHGNNGISPLLSAKLLTIFVVPRYMHGLEAVNLKQADFSKLDKYHKRMLKLIQHLPERTADEAVYLLAGQIPAQGILDKRRFILLGTLANSDSVEREIAHRQLGSKSTKSNSWFIKVNSDLHKYGLPDGHTILANPPHKYTWKETCSKAVDAYWYNKLFEGAKLKSSLKNINWNMRSRLEPHHVWTTVDPSTKDVQRAAVKARMITGTYMLQEQKAKFYHDQDASCPLCNQESETLEHFLLRCQRLDETRQSHLQQVREAVIFGYTEEIWDRLQTQELYQLILDCTFVGVLPTLPEGRVLESIESSTRRLCFAMHRAREEVMKP